MKAAKTKKLDPVARDRVATAILAGILSRPDFNLSPIMAEDGAVPPWVIPVTLRLTDALLLGLGAE